VDGIYSDRNFLSENPKLGQSEFMRLMHGLKERRVVVKEGDAKVGDEVGVGASFVDRTATETKEVRNIPNGAAFESVAHGRSGEGDLKHAQSHNVHRSFGHYTSLQRAATGLPEQAVNQVTQSEWDRRFSDQEALLQTRQSGSQAPQRARRKSVHFEQGDVVEPLGNGVPSSLQEATSNIASVPGASSAWQEAVGDDLDFDEETFYGFNGPMQTAHDTRTGVSDLERWKKMENQWTDYLGQMRMKEGSDRYLFQSKNPYTAELDAQEQKHLVQSSPTFKVRQTATTPDSADTRVCSSSRQRYRPPRLVSRRGTRSA
jgi:peroxin-5